MTRLTVTHRFALTAATALLVCCSAVAAQVNQQAI
jgi:hypothetical protein